jgi:Protein of unknown function (DUF2889)
MIRVGESMMHGLMLDGSARDVQTDSKGRGIVGGEATIRASMGEGRILEDLIVAPNPIDASALLGHPVASGFRARVDEAVPEHRAAQTPLYLLLDEMPVTALISGYADLYVSDPSMPVDEERSLQQSLKADICAGWASDATMMQEIARVGRIPTPIGPPSPELERDDDPLAWHAIGSLGPGTMRRRRRIDVIDGDQLRVDAMFRDTHVDPAGVETVLHEYSLEAMVDKADLVVRSCVATPMVLPWIECPSAAASAGRLVGRGIDELRSFVRQDLVGTTTCTHLNDLLRSLADVAPLASQLTAGESRKVAVDSGAT